MIIPGILFGLAFLGLLTSILGWKLVHPQKRKTIIRISYFLAFIGILVSYVKMEYYSENLITSFAFLLIGFTISEIYDRMKR